MDDLLSTIMGGGQEQPDGEQGQPAENPLAGLLGGLLGGSPQPDGSSSESSGLAGSAGTGGLDQVLAPVIEQLAGKLGLSPEIAQSVVGFVLGKLLAPQAGGAERLAPVAAEGLDLSGLLEPADSEQGVDQEYLRSTSLPQELASKTGLDLDTAVKALQQVLAMLRGQKAKKPARKKPKGSGKTKPKPKPKSTAKTKPKPKSTAKTKPKPKPNSTAKTKPKPKSTAKTKPKPKSSAKTEPKPKSTAKTKPKPKPKSTAK